MPKHRGRPSLGEEWVHRNIAFTKEQFEEVELICKMAPTGQTSFQAAIRKAVGLYVAAQMERDRELGAAIERHRRERRKLVPVLPRRRRNQRVAPSGNPGHPG